MSHRMSPSVLVEWMVEWMFTLNILYTLHQSYNIQSVKLLTPTNTNQSSAEMQTKEMNSNTTDIYL